MRELDISQNGEINWINFLPKRQSSKKSFKFHKSKNSNLAQDVNNKMLKGHHSESSTFQLFSKTQTTAFVIFSGLVSSTFLDISWLTTNSILVTFYESRNVFFCISRNHVCILINVANYLRIF